MELKKRIDELIKDNEETNNQKKIMEEGKY